jgi:ATP-dependent Zn protease
MVKALQYILCAAAVISTAALTSPPNPELKDGWGNKLKHAATTAVKTTSGLIPGLRGSPAQRRRERETIMKFVRDLANIVVVHHLRAALANDRSKIGRFKAASNRNAEVRLADVLGCDEAKIELKQVIDFVAHPSKFTTLGATIPKGILLVGPPGCGKTLIAKAVAGEAGMPFISLSGSDFADQYVGVGTAKVRRLFAQARRHGKCIIFIDEIDSLGRRRNGGSSSMAMDHESTLNQLLVEMDGFNQKLPPQKATGRRLPWRRRRRKTDGILVIAGTNRRDMLDPALTRAGRFDRVVNIDPPDIHGRTMLFQKYMEPLLLADFAAPVTAQTNSLASNISSIATSGNSTDGVANVTISAEQNRALYAATLAKMTPGFTGAQTATLCNEAALRAAVDASSARAPVSSVNVEEPRNAMEVNSTTKGTFSSARSKTETRVTLQHFSDALDRMTGGLERPGHFIARSDLERTSVHEAGHVLAAWHSTHAAAPIKVSVVPRGDANGFAQVQDIEKTHQCEAELFDRLVVLMAGRVAEELVLGDPSTGAYNDLERATDLAYKMVSHLGYSKKVGLLSLGDHASEHSSGSGRALRPQVSDTTARLVDSEVRALITRAYTTCRRLLQQQQAALVHFSDELATREVLLAGDFERLLGERPLAARQVAARYERTDASQSSAHSATALSSCSPMSSAMTPGIRFRNWATQLFFLRG